jgi:hypothetical protein
MQVEKYQRTPEQIAVIESATIGTLKRENLIADNDLDVQIGYLLVKLMNDMQVNEQLANSDKKSIIDYIKHSYKELSLKDIRTAFTMIITQSFPDCTDYSFYGRFSAMYVCKMLNYYKLWKQRRNIENPPVAVDPNQKALTISPETSRANLRHIAEETYRDYVNYDRFLLINVQGVFTEMQKAGYTDDFEKLSEMYLKSAEVQAKAEGIQPTGKTEKVRQGGVNRLSALILNLPIITEVEVETSVLTIAKKLYIRDKFQYWKENNRERVFQ